MPLRAYVSTEPDGNIRAFLKMHCTVMWQYMALPALHVLIALSPTPTLGFWEPANGRVKQLTFIWWAEDCIQHQTHSCVCTDSRINALGCLLLDSYKDLWSCGHSSWSTAWHHKSWTPTGLKQKGRQKQSIPSAMPALVHHIQEDRHSSTRCCPQCSSIWFWFKISLHCSAWISVVLHVVGLVLQDQSQGMFWERFICFHLRWPTWSRILARAACWHCPSDSF